MPIAAQQLDTWSKQGGTTASADAYARIERALKADTSPLKKRNVSTYLQGSYRNATNIYGDSDVDVVVQADDAFVSNKMELPPDQLAAHDAFYSKSEYTWKNLHADVLGALQTYFGAAAVRAGNRAIWVKTGVGAREADVVPALQYRRYSYFKADNDKRAHWGVALYDAQSSLIVNYPKYHIERGQAKQAPERTAGMYKPTVRLFKNYRNWLVSKGSLAEGVAPSYFVECALFNAPDNQFVGQFGSTVPALIDYLIKVPMQSLLCQNGVQALIGESQTQWRQDRFVAFVHALRDGWRA